MIAVGAWNSYAMPSYLLTDTSKATVILTVRKAFYTAYGAVQNVPLACAMCAVADIGMAAAAVNKLAEQDPAYAEVAQQLSEKNVKIQSRRGVKKHKDKAEKTEEAPVKTEKSAEEKPKRTYRKPSGEKRPFRKDGERRPYRKSGAGKPSFNSGKRSFRNKT